jgi:phosphoglycerate dehydrogenase-like enzyme
VKILVTSRSFGRAAPEALDMLAESGIEVVRASKPSMSASGIAAEIPGFDALVVGNDTVDAGVFSAGDRLRLVHMHGTGLDAIDIRAATERGVLVANAPGANCNSVAELTLALMLVTARSIDRHIDILKSGRWERTPGHEVSGKTVGIIGLGNIGRRIVELLGGFKARIVAFDVRPDREWAKRNGVTLAAAADEVFIEADFVILALSLNAQTRQFVDERRLGLMKRGSYLINTARGALVDETALCAALRDRLIAGAAIDVFDPEPLPSDSRLRDCGATLTPHLAATSIESAANVSKIVARNVIDVLLHGRTQCAVNPGALEHAINH